MLKQQNKMFRMSRPWTDQGGEKHSFRNNNFNCLKRKGNWRKRKNRLPTCQVRRGLQIDANGLKIDFSNLYSHFVLHKSLQENQYYNFTLKTFLQRHKLQPLLLQTPAARCADGRGFPGTAAKAPQPWHGQRAPPSWREALGAAWSIRHFYP